MLTILGFSFLYYKLQKKIICHAHYTPFTYGKGLFKKFNFEKYFELKKN